MKRKEKPLRVEWWAVPRGNSWRVNARFELRRVCKSSLGEDEQMLRVEIYAVKGKK